MNKSYYLFPLLLPSLSFADELATQPEMVVTASRSAKTVEETLAAVTVINREQIEHSQQSTLPDILRGLAGVDIASNGGLGKASSVFMRGTNSNQTLILVDGVKIGSATLGLASIQDIPLEQIERIEVVRGARSSLYGSEAIGGVIQIFTRAGSGDAQPSLKFGMGSYKTQQISLGVSGAEGNSWYSLYGSRIKSDGYNTCRGSLTGGCFTVEPDKDGYSNNAYTVRLGHRFSQDLSVEAHSMRVQGTNQFDSTYNNQTDFTQQVSGLKVLAGLPSTWQMSLNLSNSRDEQRNFGNVADSRYKTDRNSWTWQNNIVISKNESLIFGYDHQTDKVDSTTAYAISSRDNDGTFAQYQYQFGKFEMLLSGRRDKNEQFGTHKTGNVSMGYSFSPAFRSFLAYSTAFRAPTFNELYYPNYGNPNIKPETSHNLELGLAGKIQQVNWGINAYQTKIDQLIGGYPIQNINKAKIRGLENTLSWKGQQWDASAMFQWLKPEDEKTGRLLPRRAQQTASLETGYRTGAWRFAGGVLAQSHRYEDAANKVRLGGYTTLNVRSEYAFDQHWSVQARLDNALDKGYETAAFYPAMGRTFFFSVRYQ